MPSRMPDDRATETVRPDRGFNALADATRGDIIARPSDGEARVTGLAGYDMALPGLLQHLRVLEAPG